MSLAKSTLLAAWYYGSLPYRRLASRREARAGRAPVAVLFYHRVADDFPNAWTISNRDFDRHLDYLQANFDLISLAEAQRRICEGNRRAAVCLTFDDGYADNCRHALPRLIRRQIPCTYFVTLKNVLTGEPFPHDAAAGRPLRPNSIEQLRALADAGVEIGAHTRTHADLGRLHDPGRLHDEVAAAAGELEALVGAPIRYFAFPYGLPENLNSHAFALARREGFAGVCSAYGGYNLPGDDAFHLQRIHADPGVLRLKNWLTIDPRKRRLPRWRPAPTDATTLPEPVSN